MNRLCTWCELLLLPLVVAVPIGAPARAESASEIEELKAMVRILMEQNERQQGQIEDLQRRLDGAPGAASAMPSAAAASDRTPSLEAPSRPVAAPASDALDAALAEIEDEAPAAAPPQQQVLGPAIFARRVGGANLRLIDLSFDLLTAVGSSTERGSTLRDLQGGAHDPDQRGFTLQQGELSLIGAVDPYFTAETHIIFGTDFIELEEAFFATTALPWNLQLEGGLFFTDYGRINPIHPHAWNWVDQPVINTRLFGGDGLRSPGASLSWLAPLPWYAEIVVGAQNAAEGDLTYSFLNDGTGVGGRPAVDTEIKSFDDVLYHTRVVNSLDLSREWTAVLGFSGLFGSNSTGGDGLTFIYGTDLTVKWLPQRNFRGWPFLVWQTELSKRDFTADRYVAGTETADGGGGHSHDEDEDEDDALDVDLPSSILRDWGGYSQLLWGFRFPWAAGIRLEYASGSGRSVVDGALVSRQNDPLRGDRFRFSPLLAYHPTHFSRLRLQYNLDHATFLGGNDLAHSVWLSAELLYGAHPAHEY